MLLSWFLPQGDTKFLLLRRRSDLGMLRLVVSISCRIIIFHRFFESGSSNMCLLFIREGIRRIGNFSLQLPMLFLWRTLTSLNSFGSESFVLFPLFSSSLLL